MSVDVRHPEERVEAVHHSETIFEEKEKENKGNKSTSSVKSKPKLGATTTATGGKK
jgi:hypothetical protein